MEQAAAASWGMTKRPQKLARRVKREQPTLYIGQWIRALGKTPGEVAEAANVNEGYLSQLISRKKRNPSNAFLQAIADVLGIPREYFNRPPPPQTVLDQISGFDPDIVRRLRAARPSKEAVD